MQVPAYYHSRRGRVYRVQRVHADLDRDGTSRYVLRAYPVRALPTSASGAAIQPAAAEVSQDVSPTVWREKLRRRQTIATPEETFEQLWQRLRLELDALSASS